MFKVTRGVTKKRAILDSTHRTISKAKTRAETLRASLRGGPVHVWVDETDDTKKYRKPRSTRGNVERQRPERA